MSKNVSEKENLYVHEQITDSSMHMGNNVALIKEIESHSVTYDLRNEKLGENFLVALICEWIGFILNLQSTFHASLLKLLPKI